MKVNDLMTERVVTVSPETSLKEVATLLLRNRISGAPVCDADGRVVGVVSETTAELVLAYVRRVPRVVAVKSELRWRVDDRRRRRHRLPTTSYSDGSTIY